jgi:hypothetical protein
MQPFCSRYAKIASPASSRLQSKIDFSKAKSPKSGRWSSTKTNAATEPAPRWYARPKPGRWNAGHAEFAFARTLFERTRIAFTSEKTTRRSKTSAYSRNDSNWELASRYAVAPGTKRSAMPSMQ